MLAVVLQDVNKHVPQLPRRTDRPPVVPLRPHLARSLKDAIEGARKTDGQALTSAAESVAVLSLDEQVHMVALDAELDDPVLPAPEGSLVRSGDRLRESKENALAAEGVKPPAGSHGDLDRMTMCVVGPSKVDDVSKLRLRPPGPIPRPAMPMPRSALGMLELELAMGTGHGILNLALIFRGARRGGSAIKCNGRHRAKSGFLATHFVAR